MRYFGRISLAILAASVGAILTILFWPLPESLQHSPPGTTTLLDVRGREIAEIASPEARVQSPCALSEMGPWFPKVAVALEDHRFYQHSGIDWHGVAAACLRNLKAGRVISGGSTITQQLAKLARGHRTRSGWSKLDETMIAWKLERRWSKEHILDEYLNRSSYGNRRIGPEAAARAYFGKPARELSLAESIFLAGVPQAPTRFNPWTHVEKANRKYARSLARLEQLGIITADQEQLLARNPPVVHRFDPPRLAPHFVDALVSQKFLPPGRVRTSLDLDLQEKAESLLRQHLSALNRYDISQAALVVIENDTGAVRAMVGSANYAASQVNGALRTRSCGSTLKPFVYLSAVDRRVLTAASLLPDTAEAVRDQFADYDPQNYNHRFLGPVRLREALGCSLNVPAVVTVSRIGARQTFFQLQKWGFEFPRQFDDYGAGFVLGNAEIRLVDLAGAYAGLARRGMAMPAKLLSAEHHSMNRVASPEAADIITDILCDNTARQRTFGAQSPLAFSQRVAVKTGTSSGFRDAWTVGFDREHTVAVWAGNFDGRPMHETFAVRSATPLWAAFMRELLRYDHPLDAPVENDRIVRREICADTGLLPSRFTQSTMNEWFLKGTEPAEDSAGLFSADGKLLLPPEYAGWSRSSSNDKGAQARVGLGITRPVANAHYSIDPALALTQQMIELSANFGRNAQWFVNGAPVAPQRDGRFFWQLAPGEWKLRVVGETGAVEETVFVE